MTLKWENIKSVFQIPKNWFHTIHDRVFKAYGIDFLHIRQNGDLDGLEVGIIWETFIQYVQNVPGFGGGSGTIKTINGKSPDDNGNLVLTVNGQSQDNNGNIHFTVDGLEITQNPTTNVWDFDFGLTPSKWLKSDENGHIVTTDADPISVDPDSEGVMYNDHGDITYKTVGEGSTYDIASGNHSHGNISSDGHMYEDKQQGTFCTQNCFCVVDPDTGLIVHSNSTFSEKAGIVGDFKVLEAIVNAATWKNGVPSFAGGSDVVKTVNGLTPNENGDVSFTVDGHAINVQQKNYDFGLTPSKWLKSDSNGHISTSDVDPIALDLGQNGFVYNTNGVASYIPYGNEQNTVAMGNHTHVHTDITDWDTATSNFVNQAWVQQYAAEKVHTHVHTDITDWDTATSQFLTASKITDVGATIGLDYDPSTHPVAGSNHGHKYTDITDWDTWLEEYANDKFITLHTVQNNIDANKTISSIFNFESGNYRIRVSPRIIDGFYNNEQYLLINSDYFGYNDPDGLQFLIQNGRTTFSKKDNTGVGTIIDPTFGITVAAVQNIESKIGFVHPGDNSVFALICGLNNDSITSDRQLVIGSADGISIQSDENILIGTTGTQYKQISLSRQPVVAEEQKDESLEIATVGWVSTNTLTTPELDPGEELVTTTETAVSQIEWTGTVLRYKKRTKIYKRGLLVKSTEDSTWTTIDTPTVIRWS